MVVTDILTDTNIATNQKTDFFNLPADLKWQCQPERDVVVGKITTNM